YHDASEILTGDMPTPIKYFNPEIQKAYKDIERAAAETLLERLPEKLREAYRPYFTQKDLNTAEKALLKAADRLCAYLKCVTEIHAGNHEFLSAAERIRGDLIAMRSEEVDFFLENCEGSFPLALDELQGPIGR
ncbi:MAG: 5'-deoxynucleotidase, partial [Defluviitaleaceae bacterium]|nr:5'-deoxynucleotidase [Defluviitaleaceae bacterium]